MQGEIRIEMGVVGKIRRVYEQLVESDEKFVQSVDINRVNKWILISASVMVLLFLVDVITTLSAMSWRSGFFERNRLAAALFGRGFQGFLAALAVKYYPLLPVAVIAYLKPSGGRLDLAIRTAKIGVLMGLMGGIILYVFVAANNLLHLVG
ncbi:MAG: hypothetical protein HY619_05150 [Thaumarchaeota archaeon]|nr:hypothetical protein [Nitrososphaerota archaeon]